jgi:hypothetical protein
MKEVNLVQVFEPGELVTWPDGWPKLPANNNRFGSKLAEKDGQKDWIAASEADLRRTLKRYGHTDAEIETMLSQPENCLWTGSSCGPARCNPPNICMHYHDLLERLDTCMCLPHVDS